MTQLVNLITDEIIAKYPDRTKASYYTVFCGEVFSKALFESLKAEDLIKGDYHPILTYEFPEVGTVQVVVYMDHGYKIYSP